MCHLNQITTLEIIHQVEKTGHVVSQEWLQPGDPVCLMSCSYRCNFFLNIVIVKLTEILSYDEHKEWAHGFLSHFSGNLCSLHPCGNTMSTKSDRLPYRCIALKVRCPWPWLQMHSHCIWVHMHEGRYTVHLCKQMHMPTLFSHVKHTNDIEQHKTSHQDHVEMVRILCAHQWTI